jgi:hypothetical protein
MTGRPSESAASHHFAEEPGDLVHAAPVEHELQRRRESPRDPLSRPARPPAAPSSAPALRSLQERACAAEARIAGEQQLPETALGMLPLHPGNPAELRTMTAQEPTQQAGAAWTRALLSRPAARSSRCGRTPPCARGRGAGDTAGAPPFVNSGACRVPDLGPTASDIDRVDADWSAAAFVVAERDPSLADSRGSERRPGGRRTSPSGA